MHSVEDGYRFGEAFSAFPAFEIVRSKSAEENTSSLHTRHSTVCSAVLWPLRALVGRQLEAPRDILCWTQTKGAEERL